MFLPVKKSTSFLPSHRPVFLPPLSLQPLLLLFFSLSLHHFLPPHTDPLFVRFYFSATFASIPFSSLLPPSLLQSTTLCVFSSFLLPIFCLESPLLPFLSFLVSPISFLLLLIVLSLHLFFLI